MELTILDPGPATIVLVPAQVLEYLAVFVK
jgi:hypothetical protein